MAGHRHTPPNHHVVEVDEDYRISRLDRTVVVTDVDVCVELPSNEVLVGHTVRIVAGAGDVIVCTCSAAIEGADEDGQIVVPRGSAVELTLSDDKCNCSKVWVTDCCPKPNAPPCVCAKAFDDAFIRALMSELDLALSAVGGPEASAAHAARFCEDGCTQVNLGPPTCGRAAILAGYRGAQGFFNTFVSSDLVITRTANPDCTVTVNVHRKVTLTLLSAPETEILNYGIETFVFDPSCCLQSESVIDLRGFGGCC